MDSVASDEAFCENLQVGIQANSTRFGSFMSIQSITSTARSDFRSRVSAFGELTKLRISVMVLFTFVVAGILAGGLPFDPLKLFYATIGMFLIAGSGNAMNMYLERYTDFLMPRTSGRPLPANRLSSTEVVLFAAVSFGISVGIFLTLVNWQTAVCGILTWILYVCVYTPLKTRTIYNTEVGAIPGAMPILMGSLATTGTIDTFSLMFFAVLLIWQFPHFMSIAWLYRDQYRQGGLKMITCDDHEGVRTGRKAILTCVVLIVVSCFPAVVFRTGIHSFLFIPFVLACGWWYLSATLKFAADTNDQTARKLLKTSVLYLPMYMLILVIARLA